MKQYQMLIGGKWVDAVSGDTYIRYCPATGEPMAQYPNGGVEDTRLAIRAARESFDSGIWRDKSPGERAGVLLKAAALLKARGEEIAALESRDVGMAISTIGWAGYYAADVFEYFAGLIRNHCGRTIDLGPKFLGMTILEPVGVAGIITPWNFPLPMAAWKLAPALAVGCSVVLKPSELTPTTSLILGEILKEAGVPDGVVNIVIGPGAVVGAEIVSNSGVDKVALTGSVNTGRSVINGSAGDIKKISLELGGKSPNIVFADADLDAALAGAMGIFNNAGQVCNAPSRLLVEESIAEKFVSQLSEMAASLKLGLPSDPTTGMGPIVSPIHMERVMGFIDRGIKAGAKLVCGGHRATGNGLENGNFVEPTIFMDVTREMEIVQEEIFGPVLVVQTFRTVDEAITIANDSKYGLAAGVWTNSMDKANTVIRGLRAGTVWVNTWGGTVPELPNGGYKHSGYGRELGPEGFEGYVQIKSVHLCTT
jgi:betaine-aldehyde dehydrogenase